MHFFIAPSHVHFHFWGREGLSDRSISKCYPKEPCRSMSWKKLYFKSVSISFYGSSEIVLHECFISEWWCGVWMKTLQLIAQWWKKKKRRKKQCLVFEYESSFTYKDKLCKEKSLSVTVWENQVVGGTWRLSKSIHSWCGRCTWWLVVMCKFTPF